jgi:kynurenine 3-monooxygenase
MLRKRGFDVEVYEKRQDPRVADLEEGRSINLALSHRGIQALKSADAYDGLKDVLIPMTGRLMHDPQEQLTVQPYGQKGQHINSVSRLGLNRKLITQAEESGVIFNFDSKIVDVDIDATKFTTLCNGQEYHHSAEVIIGTDGAFSVLRSKMQVRNRFNYSQHFIDHGYKELEMPAINGDFAMEPNYLHIWPRGNFMLIALPNPNKTFTCTLFFPFEGTKSFENIRSEEEIRNFFAKEFPDAARLIPAHVAQYQNNPTSSLVTIRCFPWNYKNCMLLGDAAHAIVPFYGQGMNAAFEDCRLLAEQGDREGFEWPRLFSDYAVRRKPDADAIADLALRNFIEMRDRVADEGFLERKKADAQMHKCYGEQWVPMYTQVSFSDIPYAQAMQNGLRQEQALLKAQKEGRLEDHEYILELFNLQD